MYVLTIDQRRSRRSRDKVDGLLAQLNPEDVGRSPYPLVRVFERTAGDELQGILDDASAVVNLALELCHTEDWSVGIGVGDVRTPLPETTRAGAGPAFEHARTAVTEAKKATAHVAVRSGGDTWEDVDAIMQLLGALSIRRRSATREAGELMEQGLTQEQVAQKLGISQQAVSGRLKSGLWAEDRRVRRVAAGLLQQAHDAAGSAVAPNTQHDNVHDNQGTSL